MKLKNVGNSNGVASVTLLAQNKNEEGLLTRLAEDGLETVVCFEHKDGSLSPNRVDGCKIALTIKVKSAPKSASRASKNQQND